MLQDDDCVWQNRKRCSVDIMLVLQMERVQEKSASRASNKYLFTY